MPMYCFRCPDCGTTKEVIRPIDQRNDPIFCGWCVENKGLAVMRRDLQAERLGSTDLPYDRPVMSDAMGINPDQIPDFKRAHPNVEVARDGRIVLRSHRERKRVMKELGYMDRDGY